MDNTKHYDAYLEQKLREKAEKFKTYFYQQNWSGALYIYENVRDIALFLEVPEKLLSELLGNRQDDDESKHVVGIIPEAMVNDAMEQCRIIHDTKMAEIEERKREWDEGRQNRGKYTKRKTK